MTRDVEELQRDGSPLDDATLRRVLTNFQALDKDGDGHLTPGEFREGLGMLGMDEGFCRLVFDTFDTQGDGRIDQREFVTNMAVMLHPENLEAQISLAFDAYDVNKDGKLTEGELRQVIACVFSALDKMGLTNEHSSEDVADELFKQLDADGKGHVTKADYVRLARTKPDTFRQIGLGLASPMSQRRSRRVSSVSSGKHVLASSGGDGDRGTDGTSASSSGRLRTRRGRKRGNTVTFGHQNFELVVQMMLGIRLAAGKANEAPPPDLAQLQASRSHSMKAREREQREAGASTAAQPAAAAAGAGASEELPAGWSRGTDDSGHPFYRHAQTKEVRYTRPRRRSADLSGSSSSGSHRGGVVDAEAASSSTPHDGSDWHYAEPSIVILKKASKDGKCGITLSSTSNAVGHTFVEAMAAGGPAAASHKVFVGDLVLAVNSVPCAGCSSGCRVMREAEGEVRLLIRAKISDHGYGDCAKFTIPSHTRGVDRTVEFKDYAPQVFRKIRALFGVPEREYMMSLGPEQILGELLLGTMGSLSELFSEGKSGSFFYFSNDALYLIKTIPHREERSLARILPRYVRHVERFPHTLLPRFMGAHRLILPGVGKVHFVVTSNVFSTDRAIHERYDLKGSTYGRTSDKLLREGVDAVRKDLDLQKSGRQFRVGGKKSEAFLEQIQHDIDFLREMELMDYSLLCGVHYPRRDDGSASLPPQSPPAPDGATPLSPPAVIREESSDHRPAPASPDVVAEAARASRASYAANYAAAPAPAPSRSGSGNGGSGDGSAGQLRSGSPVLRPSTAGAMPPLRPLGEKGIALPKPPWVDHWDGAIDGDVEAGAEPELYFIGIIDILTSWSAAKSAENFVKMVAHPTEGSSGISCVPPDTYASRFLSKLQRWIH